MKNNNINKSTHSSNRLQLNNRKKKTTSSGLANPGRTKKVVQPSHNVSAGRVPLLGPQCLLDVRSSTQLNGILSPNDSELREEVLNLHSYRNNVQQKYSTENHNVIAEPEYFGMFSNQWSDHERRDAQRHLRKPSIGDNNDTRVLGRQQTSESRALGVKHQGHNVQSAHLSMAIMGELQGQILQSDIHSPKYFSQIHRDNNQSQFPQEAMSHSASCNLPSQTMSSVLRTQAEKSRWTNIEKLQPNVLASETVRNVIGSSSLSQTGVDVIRQTGKQFCNIKPSQFYKPAGKSRYDKKLFLASDLVVEKKTRIKVHKGILNPFQKEARSNANGRLNGQKSTPCLGRGLLNAQRTSHPNLRPGNSQPAPTNETRAISSSRQGAGQRTSPLVLTSQPPQGLYRAQSSAGAVAGSQMRTQGLTGLAQLPTQTHGALTARASCCSQGQQQIKADNQPAPSIIQILNQHRQNLGEAERPKLENPHIQGETRAAHAKRRSQRRRSRRQASISSKTSSPATRGFSTSISNLTNASTNKQIAQGKLQKRPLNTNQHGRQVISRKNSKEATEQKIKTSLSQRTLETIKKLQDVKSNRQPAQVSQLHWQEAGRAQAQDCQFHSAAGQSQRQPLEDRSNQNCAGQASGIGSIANHDINIGVQSVVPRNEEQEMKQGAHKSHVMPLMVARARPLFASNVAERQTEEAQKQRIGWIEEHGGQMKATVANQQSEAPGVIGVGLGDNELKHNYAQPAYHKTQVFGKQGPADQENVHHAADQIIRLNQDQIHLKNTPRALKFLPEDAEKTKKSTTRTFANRGNSVFREFRQALHLGKHEGANIWRGGASSNFNNKENIPCAPRPIYLGPAGFMTQRCQNSWPAPNADIQMTKARAGPTFGQTTHRHRQHPQLMKMNETWLRPEGENLAATARMAPGLNSATVTFKPADVLKTILRNENGGRQGYFASMNLDGQPPKKPTYAEIGESPGKISGFTSSFTNHYSDSKNSPTTSQMQSVSSDSQQQLSNLPSQKPINALFSSNFLCDYNDGAQQSLAREGGLNLMAKGVPQQASLQYQTNSKYGHETIQQQQYAQTSNYCAQKSRNNQSTQIPANFTQTPQASLTGIQAAPSIMEFDHTVPSGQQTNDKTNKSQLRLQQLRPATTPESSSSAQNEQSTPNDSKMLIIDKDVRGRRHSGQEDEYHFHEHGRGFVWGDREAYQLQTTDPAHLAIREGDINATVCMDRELAIDQVAAQHLREEELENNGIPERKRLQAREHDAQPLVNCQLSGSENNQQNVDRKILDHSSPPIVLKLPLTDSASGRSHESESIPLKNSNQDHQESIKMLNSSERLTTQEKSREDQRKSQMSNLPGDHCTDRDLDHDFQEDDRIERRPKFNDISEQKQTELKEMERSKDLYQELLNQDSFINGTFHLDNTHSLEKFREIEKMCENQVDSSRELQMESKPLEADRRTTDDAAGEASGEMPPQLSPVVSPQISSDAPADVSAEQLASKRSDQVENAPDQQDCQNLHSEHYQQTLNTMMNLHLLEPHSEKYTVMKKIRLPDPDPNIVELWSEIEGLSETEGANTLNNRASNAKVLFFDIDETMVHCIDDRDPPSMKGEIRLQINLQNPTHDFDQAERASNSVVNQDMPDSIDIDVNIRPGLLECLLDLKNSYQIVSFTASDQLYADAILDHIDPDNQIFSCRLYRQHCVETEYGLIKDLRLIENRNLKDMVIVDNSALSFAFNVNNGIPILPFYDNWQDEELKHLRYYLNCLQESRVHDVRVHNDEAFGLLRLSLNSAGDGGPSHAVTNQPSLANSLMEESHHHAISKEYLQCDPMEMVDEHLNTSSQRKYGLPSNSCQLYRDSSNQFADQPINLLSLMNTNHVIEERSNEDGDQSSKQASPAIRSYRHKLCESVYGSSSQYYESKASSSREGCNELEGRSNARVERHKLEPQYPESNTSSRSERSQRSTSRQSRATKQPMAPEDSPKCQI